jgi:hypothetical protein
MPQRFKIRLLSRECKVLSLPGPFSYGPTICKEKLGFEIQEADAPFRSAKFVMEGTGAAVQGIDAPTFPETLPGDFTLFSAFSATNRSTQIDLEDFEGSASFTTGRTEMATLKMDGNIFKMMLRTSPVKLPIKGVKEGALSTRLDETLVREP